jgi:hypothetical protein
MAAGVRNLDNLELVYTATRRSSGKEGFRDITAHKSGTKWN